LISGFRGVILAFVGWAGANRLGFAFLWVQNNRQPSGWQSPLLKGRYRPFPEGGSTFLPLGLEGAI